MLAPRAIQVDAAGDYLLAGSTLTGEQHGSVSRSDLARQFEQSGHLGISGNHPAAIEATDLFLAHQGKLEFGASLVQGTANRQSKLVRAIERLA